VRDGWFAILLCGEIEKFRLLLEDDKKSGKKLNVLRKFIQRRRSL